jgi:hypothetical protein
MLITFVVDVTITVVSRAKWGWQHRRQPAHNLAHFNEASRGPLGALLLCFRIRALLGWNFSTLKYGSKEPRSRCTR